MTFGLLALGLLAATAQAKHPDFKEKGVRVLHRFEGDQAGDGFGWVSTTLPDIDGDGVNELVLTSFSRSESRGRVTVYSGRSRTVLATFDGDAEKSFAGYSVGTGDFDQDGVADLIIGGNPVKVFSGKSLEAIHVLPYAAFGFGHSVAGVGDLNHDGVEDLLVGSEQTLNDQRGVVHAVSGKSGKALWRKKGENENSFYGSGVGAVGDLNGDGVSDVVVGARGEAYTHVLSGRDGAVIRTLTPADPKRSKMYGRFFAMGAGDVDGDGLHDVFVADYASDAGRGEAYVYSGKTGRVLHHLAGKTAKDGFGPGRVIDDVDGDGTRDLIIASYTNGEGAEAAGKATLFSGRNGRVLRTFTFTKPNAAFGVDAIAIGDVNGDGLTDYLVTAVGLSFANKGPGTAYVIAGEKLAGKRG